MKVDKKLKIRQDGIFFNNGMIYIPKKTTIYITKKGELIITSLYKEFLKLMEDSKSLKEIDYIRKKDGS